MGDEDAVAADVDRHGVPRHGEEGNDSTELTSLLYHHQLEDDIAAVDVPWDMSGVIDAEGNPRPDRHGLLDFVMAKDDGQWQIVVMHNLDLTALPSSTVSQTTTNR
jgi:hypothetical protein